MINTELFLPQLWLMPGEHVEAFLAELLALRSHINLEVQAAGRGRMPIADEQPLEIVDGVARIHLEGPIMKTVPAWMRMYGVRAAGAADTQAQIQRAVNDPAVKGVLLVIDSPGGTLAGVQELSDAINRARAVKPINAYASDLAASAAYWIGASCSKFTANRGAQVGSIGVYVVNYDASRAFENAGIKVHVIRAGEHKGAGIMGTPFTDEQRARFQAMVDGAAAMFVEAVARGRKMPEAKVRELATGDTWYGAEAVELGLLDGVHSLDDAHADCAQLMPIDLVPFSPADARRAEAPTETAPEGAEGNDAMTAIKPGAAAAPQQQQPTTEQLAELAQLKAEKAELEQKLALERTEKDLLAKTVAASKEDEKTKMLDDAIAAGTVPPASRDDYLAYAKACGEDTPRFAKFLAQLPKQTRPTASGRTTERPTDAVAQGGDEEQKPKEQISADAKVSKRLGVGTAAMDFAAEISHYTADGKVQLKNGDVLTMKEANERAQAAA